MTDKLSFNFEKLDDVIDKWGYIRQVYIENLYDIITIAKIDIRKFHKVYLMNWPSHFSPIEQQAWNSIRDYGGIVLYPQFPLFNFFIDFANPYLRIGLELDGKQHDKEKDQKRDQLLAEYNWKIFRVTGAEMNNLYPNLEEIEEQELVEYEKQLAIENWLMNSGDGLIWAIRYWYFNKPEDRAHLDPLYYHAEDYENKKIDLSPMVKETLKCHCSSKLVFSDQA